MEPNQKKLISEFVKNGRLAKGLTQKELSERTNIIIRSIQRIENEEIIPRSYTLKTIAEALGITYDTSQFTEAEKKEIIRSERSVSKIPKAILSVGLTLVIVFLGLAFIFQSPKFPETGFEALLFWAVIVMIITAMLFLLWKKR